MIPLLARSLLCYWQHGGTRRAAVPGGAGSRQEDGTCSQIARRQWAGVICATGSDFRLREMLAGRYNEPSDTRTYRLTRYRGASV